MNCKIVSWNVNGIRSPSMNLLTKGKNKELNPDCNFSKLLNDYSPDIVCLGETKCQQKNEEEIGKYLPFKYKSWNSSTDKLGYSGVAVWSKLPFKDLGFIEGLEDNKQGRYLFLEFDEFYLINVYVPNTGKDNNEYRKNIWDPSILNLLNKLKKSLKPTIYCGDLNVVNDYKDIYNPDIIKKGKSPGVKDFERNDFKNLLNIGFTDSMRFIEPENNYWTWWDPRSKARDKDNGWRLDYFLVSDSSNIRDAKICKEIYGSDHCPIYLEFEK